MKQTIRYSSSDLTIDVLRNAISEIWSDTCSSSSTKKILNQDEANSIELLKMSPGALFEIKRDGAGLAPGVTEIILICAGIVAKDIWVKIILPRLVQRFGVDSLKPLDK